MPSPISELHRGRKKRAVNNHRADSAASTQAGREIAARGNMPMRLESSQRGKAKMATPRGPVSEMHQGRMEAQNAERWNEEEGWEVCHVTRKAR